MMTSCKDLSLPKPNSEAEIITSYSRRLNYASNANKAQRTTIDKLRVDLETQTELNKTLTTKLDRVVQLCNTRQILIRHLKEDINKIKGEKTEVIDENKALLDELYQLRYTSKMKLSATQEDLMLLSLKNQEDQEDLKTQIISLKVQIDNLKKELKLKEIQIAEFVNKTKDTVSTELGKLTQTIENGATRLKTAEDKSKELCKGIIKLLTLFYQRRMARRLVEDKVGSPALKTAPTKDNKSKGNQKQNPTNIKKKNPSNSSLTSIVNSTEESIKEVKKDLYKVGPSAVNSLKDVIGQFHILVHKSDFSEELGKFLFNNIVNPFLYEST